MQKTIIKPTTTAAPDHKGAANKARTVLKADKHGNRYLVTLLPRK